MPFAPMTDEELAEFDGAPLFPPHGSGLKLLLDNCVFLWFQADSPIFPTARAHILDPKTRFISCALSVWEIARKYELGRISLPSHPSDPDPGGSQRLGNCEPFPHGNGRTCG